MMAKTKLEKSAEDKSVEERLKAIEKTLAEHNERIKNAGH